MSLPMLKRALGLLVAGLAVTGAIAVQATAADAAPNIAITNNGVTRHGTYATVNLSLNIPGDVTVEITDQPMIGTAPYHHTQLGNRFDHYYQGGHGQNFHVNVTGLEPNTKYWVTVMAYDPVGYSFAWAVNQSSFTTQHRLVSIDLTSVDVINDGDPLGCGEIFGFVFGGHDAGYGPRDLISSVVPYASRCDGLRYPLDIHSGTMAVDPVSIASVSIPFVMDVTVVDDDTAFGTCSNGLNCGEGGVVRFTPDLRALDGATKESYTKSISFHAGGQGVDVVFNGTQTVSYA
jgi:hypothetical protein